MVRRARSDHPQYPCTVGSLTRLDYPDATFEGVLFWYSTIHNPDADLDRMIAEMERVLRPGGVLLVAFQVGEGMRRVGQGFAALGYDIVMNRYHRTRADMVARMEAHGLEVAAQMERGSGRFGARPAGRPQCTPTPDGMTEPLASATHSHSMSAL